MNKYFYKYSQFINVFPPQLFLAFLVLGVASAYAMAPPLASLLHKRKLAQDQDKLQAGSHIPIAVDPQQSEGGEEAWKQGESEALRNVGSKQGAGTHYVQATQQQDQEEQEEQEEQTGAESRQQFSVVALQDLDTAATGVYVCETECNIAQYFTLLLSVSLFMKQ